MLATSYLIETHPSSVGASCARDPHGGTHKQLPKYFMKPHLVCDLSFQPPTPIKTKKGRYRSTLPLIRGICGIRANPRFAAYSTKCNVHSDNSTASILPILTADRSSVGAISRSRLFLTADRSSVGAISRSRLPIPKIL